MKIFQFAILVAIVSCNNNQTNTSEKATGSTIHGNAKDTIVTAPPLLAECYVMILKQDTAWLQLSIKDSVVTGDLNYKWHEKDNNTGTFKGVIRDSLLLANYTFQSEGMMSVREIIFKIAPGKLQQAFGEMEEKDNKQVFKRPLQLKYDSNLIFLKTLCR